MMRRNGQSLLILLTVLMFGALIAPSAVHATPTMLHVLPEDSVYQAGCPLPRPPVRLAVTPQGDGQIQVVVTAGAGTLQLIRFGQMLNARVVVPGTGQQLTSNQEIKPPDGSTTFTFNVFVDPAVPAGQTPPRSTVSLDIFDGCGPTQAWSTFVGGGAAALQSTASITDAQVTEGNAGNTQISFTVTLSVPSSQVVTYSFTTGDGTATSASDYVAANGTVTFNPGETQKSVVVQVRGDFDEESDEAFTVSLGTPVNGGLGRSQATARINNDDTGPSANGDTFVASIGQPLSVAAPGVLANDQAGTQTAQVVKFGGLDAGGTVDTNNAGDTVNLGGGGSLIVRANGSFDFTPPAGAGPTFSFRYRAQSLSGTSEATVIIGVQTPPVAVADPNYVANGATPLNVPEGTGVLANDDRGIPPGNVASFGTVNPASTPAGTALDLGNGGSLNVQANGSFAFTAPSIVTGDFTFQYRVTNAAGSSDATVTINVTRGPVITTSAGSTAYAEGDSPVPIDTALTITNPGGGNVTSATVVIANPQDGALETLAATVAAGGIVPSYSAATHTLTLTGPASAADFQTVLRGVSYDNSSQGPGTTARTIQFQGVGNGQTGNQANKTVTVASINDAPVLANLEAGALVYNEGDAATAVTSSVTVVDIDHVNLAGATVGITTGCVPAEDILALTTNPQNGITAVYTAATCTLTMTGSSSVANYQAALRDVTYRNSSNTPTTAARTVAMQVTDSIDPSNVVSRGLTVTSVNSPPVVTTSVGTTAFTEGGGAVAVDGSVTVTDLDNANLASATVTISNLLDAGQETLAANVGGTGITANYVAPTLTLTGPNTVANFQQVLQTVTYNNSSNAPTTTDRTLTFVANDGTNNSAPATKTVSITAVNSAPVVTTTVGVTAFTENGPAATVDAGVTVTDGDNVNLASATIIITNVQDGVSESLDTDLTGLAGITKGTTSAAGTFTLTLSGPDTVANFQTALQRVTYTNASDTPTTAPNRVIRFQVNDGTVDSNTADKSVSVAAVDDPPTAVNDAATVLEDAAATAIDVLGNDTDVDGGPKSVASVTQPTNGTAVITGGGAGLTYQPDADYCNAPPGTTPDTFTYTLNGGSVGTVSVTVTCINDAPSFAMGPNQGPVDNQTGAGAPSTQTVNNWATAITTGPANENGQALTFSVTTNNDGLFNTLPAISATGTLTYTTNPATFGTATVTVSLMDDGGTANGGVDTFAPVPNTFTIQTQFPAPDAVNDGPSADYTANGGIPIDMPVGVGVLVNDVLRGGTISGYGATVGNEQATIGQPTATAQGGTVELNADGSFRYTPPCSVPGGSDTFKYLLTNGGGTDTATVTITVDAGVCFVDSSAAAGGDGSSLKPFQNFTAVPAGRPNIGAIYVLNGATGTYTGAAGIALKTGEHLLGQGVAASGNLPFTPATRSDLTVLPAAGSTPTLNTSAGDLVTLGSGNTLKGFNAGNVGAGATAITGSTFGTLSITQVAVTTNGRALNLDTGTVSNGSITSITSTGGTNNVRLKTLTTTGSTFALGTGALSGATGDAFLVDGGTGTVSYGGTVASGSAHSVNVTNKTGGTVTLNGAITDTDTGISLTSNTGATVAFTGAITANTGANAAFTATGGGTVTAIGAGSTLTTTTATALNVVNTNIGGGNLTFQSISSNGGANGITLNNTGTTSGTHGGLTVTGVGTTDGTGGTIQSKTTRGASFISTRDVTLKNMNFTNAATADFPAAPTGLSLGVNTADNAALHFQTVFAVLLDNLNINGSAEHGINGHNVTGFRLLNSVLTNLGQGADEDGIHFFNMLGTSEITDTSITSSGDDNVNIQNNTNLGLPAGMTATGNLTISGGSANTGVLGSGYLMGIRGTSNTTVTIDGVTSNNNFSGGVVIDTFDTATSVVEVKNSSITNNNDGIAMSSANGSTKFDIHDNPSFAGNDFARISILKAAFSTGGTLQGKIRNNSIVVEDNASGDAIVIFNAGAGPLTVAITGNDIDYRGAQRPILLQGGQDGAAQINATVTGNTIDMQLDGTNDAFTGINVNIAITSPTGDGSAMCADIGGAGALRNVFTHSLGGTMAAGDMRIRQRMVSTVTLPGYAGAAGDNAAVVAYIAGRNTLVNSPTATATNEFGVTVGAGGFVGGGACTQPVFP